MLHFEILQYNTYVFLNSFFYKWTISKLNLHFYGNKNLFSTSDKYIKPANNTIT